MRQIEQAQYSRESFPFPSDWVEFARTLGDADYIELMDCITLYGLFRELKTPPQSAAEYFNTEILPELERQWQELERQQTKKEADDETE